MGIPQILYVGRYNERNDMYVCSLFERRGEGVEGRFSLLFTLTDALAKQQAIPLLTQV